MESGGGGVAFCVNQMCFFHSYSAEFWYCVTMALCHCYFLCVFPEIKSSFLDILDIYLFFFFFQQMVPVISEYLNQLKLSFMEKPGSQFKLFLKNHFIQIQHNSGQCHVIQCKSPVYFLHVFTPVLWKKYVKL